MKSGGDGNGGLKRRIAVRSLTPPRWRGAPLSHADATRLTGEGSAMRQGVGYSWVSPRANFIQGIGLDGKLAWLREER